jgi:hypothetical protein
MYIDLKQSVENVINVKSDQKRLDYFAKERYDEKYPRVLMTKVGIIMTNSK